MGFYIFCIVNKTEYERRFQKIKNDYSDLHNFVVGLLEKKASLIDDLRAYAQERCKICEQDILKAKSVRDVILIIEEESCNVINITAIEGLLEVLKVDEAQAQTKEYNGKVQKFCNDIRLNMMCNKPLSDRVPRSSEILEFILEWEPDEHTLNEICHLLEKAFGKMVKSVLVYSIRKVNSIAIICYAPLHLMEKLIKEVKSNLSILQSMNQLISLHIADNTVYQKVQPMEIEDDKTLGKYKMHAVRPFFLECLVIKVSNCRPK